LETNEIILRSASYEDCGLLWVWTNDPGTRAMSFISKDIAWEEHVQWFQTKIESSDCILWIAESTKQEALGQIRFDICGAEATMSISIDRKFRNKGYGSRIIRSALQKLFINSNVQVVYAYIKPENKASIHAFLNASFQIAGTMKVHDQLAIQMTFLSGQQSI